MTTPSERLEKSLTKDNLWLYILTLLKEGEMYPYEIRKAIKERFGFSPGNVTAYIVLKKLQSGGYVRVKKKLQSGGPVRTYYIIMEQGKKELELAGEIYRKKVGILSNLK
jgi:PadR family transcriptional regulator PadR